MPRIHPNTLTRLRRRVSPPGLGGSSRLVQERRRGGEPRASAKGGTEFSSPGRSMARLLFAMVAFLLVPEGVLSAPQSSSPSPARRPRLALPPSCSTVEEIRHLQASLRARALYRGPLSGRLDRSTRRAIAQYQQIVGLRATSRPDVATCRQLLTTGPSTNSLTAPSPNPSLQDSSVPPADWASLAEPHSGLAEKSRSGLAKAGRDLSQGSRKLSGTLEHSSQQAETSIIGRPDSRIHRDVRQLLEGDPWTTHWPTSIKEGVVTLKVPRKNRLDPAPVVESIRRVAGVKAVFLILF